MSTRARALAFVTEAVLLVVSLALCVTQLGDRPAVLMSFLVTLALLLVGVRQHLRSARPSLFQSSVLTFGYAFLWLAPVVQIGAGAFPNTLPIDDHAVVSTNALIVVFGLAYAFARGRPEAPGEDHGVASMWPDHRVAAVQALACVAVLAAFGPVLLQSFSERDLLRNLSSAQQLLVGKFLFYLVLFVVLWVVMDPGLRQRRHPALRWALIAVALAALVLFKNPFNERRNALGPIYLTVLFAARPRWLTNVITLPLLLGSTILALPLVSRLTHTSTSLADAGSALAHELGILDPSRDLRSLDFDAFAQIAATMQFVAERGATAGHQLLGSLLFFVPRPLWPGKPDGSGKLLGDYLIEREAMWFDNLSCPLPAEGYLNFGWVGVVVFAIALGLFARRCDRYQASFDLRWIFAVYASLHMVFLLRGDLTSALAYLLGVLAALWWLPRLLHRLAVTVDARVGRLAAPVAVPDRPLAESARGPDA